MRRPDLFSIIIFSSITLILSLAIFLFLNFFTVNFSIEKKGETTNISKNTEFPINSYPIYEFLGILTEKSSTFITLDSHELGVSMSFNLSDSTEFFTNETTPPYKPYTEGVFKKTALDSFNVGDHVNVTTTEDLRLDIPYFPLADKVILVQNLSHYIRGTVIELDTQNDRIIINRNDNFAQVKQVIISLSNTKLITFGYVNEPDRNYRITNKENILPGYDVLVYSDSPVSQNATAVDGAYLKLTSPEKRPE